MDKPKFGQIIKLIPKTRAGKNKLQNKTNLWRVTNILESVICLNNGPGFCIAEIPDRDKRWPDARWIRLPVDENFDWEIMDS